MKHAIANRLIDLLQAALGAALILVGTLAPEEKHLDSLLVIGSGMVGQALPRLSDMRKSKQEPPPAGE